MVRWLGVRRVTEFVETPHPHRTRSRSDRSFFPTQAFRPRNICSRRTSISFASTFTCTTSAISRRYLLASAKPGRRTAAHARRVRHGHDPPPRRGTGRNARLACRQRGAMRSGRHDFLRLDRRMVHRRTGDHRLGFRARHARSRSRRNPSSPCAKNLARTTRLIPHRRSPADAICLGHRLFLQRRENARGMPRIVRQNQISGLRSDSGR